MASDSALLFESKRREAAEARAAELAATNATLTKRVAELEAELSTLHRRINGAMIYINDGGETWNHPQEIDDGEKGENCDYCGMEWPCLSEIIRQALTGDNDTELIESNVESDEILYKVAP